MQFTCIVCNRESEAFPKNYRRPKTCSKECLSVHLTARLKERHARNPIRGLPATPRQLEAARKRGDLIRNTGKGHRCKATGYVIIYVDRQRLLQHRYVMSQHLKRPLSSHEVVHHINGVRHDNRIENLQLCESHTDHINTGGHLLPVETPCIKCGQPFGAKRAKDAQQMCKSCRQKNWRKGGIVNPSNPRPLGTFRGKPTIPCVAECGRYSGLSRNNVHYKLCSRCRANNDSNPRKDDHY